MFNILGGKENLMSRAIDIGDVVENFRLVGEVVEIKEDGSLVLKQVNSSLKWIADPEKCALLREKD